MMTTPKSLPEDLVSSIVRISSASPETDVSDGGGCISFFIPGNDTLRLGARTPGCCTPEEMKAFPVGKLVRLELSLIGNFYSVEEAEKTYIKHADRPFVVYSGISRVCCRVDGDVYLEAGGLIFDMENDLEMCEIPKVGDYIRFDGIFFDAFTYDEEDACFYRKAFHDGELLYD